ncbi:MAG: DoxX family protein [Acidobacteria bacterium]|nr:DoxX family protein [Acidobacteriota bacterium]
MTKTFDRDNATSIGLLTLRVGIAGFLMTHGWGKLQMILDDQYEMMGDPIGIGNVASLWLLMFAELICGGLVVIGLATRIAAIPPIIAMGVAAFVAHGTDPWTMSEGARLFFEELSESWASKQPALMFLVVFLTLALTGPGRYSLDELIRRRRERGHQPA